MRVVANRRTQAAFGVLTTLSASAYVVFGQTLKTVDNASADNSDVYFVVGSVLIFLSAAVLGVHAIWLGLLIVLALAVGWQHWFSDDSRCYNGMDGIGCLPTDVVWTLPFFVPAAGAGVIIRLMVLASRNPKHQEQDSGPLRPGRLPPLEPTEERHARLPTDPPAAG